MSSNLAALLRWRELITHLAIGSIGKRYRRTFLGVVWTIVHPLAMALIISVVYGRIMGGGTNDYTAYLCAGLFIWQFISEAASTACTVLVDSQGFIRQTNVPMIVYPAVSLISSFVTFLVGLTALVLGLILFSTPTWWSIPLMIPGLLLLALFGWGVVCIQSVVGAVVRDHQHITSIALLALFFTTPIMYPVAVMDRVGQTWLYQYNPLYYLLTTVRHPLLRGELPPAGVYGVAAAFALGVAVVGHLLFCRVDRRVVRYL